MSCGRSIKLNTPLFQLRSSNTSSGAMPESGSYCLTFEPLTTRQLLFFPTMEAKQTGITIRIAYWYAVAQYLTRPNSVKEGAQRVLQWLAHDGLGLKKMTVCMKFNVQPLRWAWKHYPRTSRLSPFKCEVHPAQFRHNRRGAAVGHPKMSLRSPCRLITVTRSLENFTSAQLSVQKAVEQPFVRSGQGAASA
jgi:hypothetical protein